MKNLIKLNGSILGKILINSNNSTHRTMYLEKYEELIKEFSTSIQKDFLRISVIKSLKVCINQISFQLISENFPLFLKYW